MAFDLMGENKDLKRVLKQQQELLSTYQKENGELKLKNRTLRMALSKAVTETEVYYSSLEPQFDNISKKVLDIIVHEVKTYQHPVTYGQVVKVFKSRYPMIPVSNPETITRRMRAMVDPRYCKEKFGVEKPLLHRFHVGSETLFIPNIEPQGAILSL